MTSLFQADFFASLCFADGTLTPPKLSAVVKRQPKDFWVKEVMDFECTGEGEHIWLEIEKTQRHTTDVAKQLAKYAGLAIKNVGYSGMKDHQAITSQWFSLWMPGVTDQDLPDWLAMDEGDASIRVLNVARHNKKLRRGTHKHNNFKIRLCDVCAEKPELNVIDIFEGCIENLMQKGVPNYFGEQRFGYGGGNLNKALDWFKKGYRIKQPNKRSILLSSARAWLFNVVLSERLAKQTWLQAYLKEPLNLSGSNSLFVCEDSQAAQARLDNLDINTTGPMWGKTRDALDAKLEVEELGELNEFESSILANYPEFLAGLERAGLSYERRSLRCMPSNVEWAFDNNDIHLSFSLPRGQYATMVLRELFAS